MSRKPKTVAPGDISASSVNLFLFLLRVVALKPRQVRVGLSAIALHTQYNFWGIGHGPTRSLPITKLRPDSTRANLRLALLAALGLFCSDFWTAAPPPLPLLPPLRCGCVNMIGRTSKGTGHCMKTDCVYLG